MLPSPKSVYSIIEAFSTVQRILVLVALAGDTIALMMQVSPMAMLWEPLSRVTLVTGTTGS